jgi:hypothetical protein
LQYGPISDDGQQSELRNHVNKEPHLSIEIEKQDGESDQKRAAK